MSKDQSDQPRTYNIDSLSAPSSGELMRSSFERMSRSAFEGLELQREQIRLIRKLGNKKWTVCLSATAMVILVCACLATVNIAFFRQKLDDRTDDQIRLPEEKKARHDSSAEKSPSAAPLTGKLKDQLQLNVDLRNDHLLQDCQGPVAKRSFPDVDYAFLGYNILKGYPLTVGHDAGFTFPIFSAEYSDEGQTADCRYSVPKGVILIPDISCKTSFSSEIIKTKHAFREALEASAEVSGGGWGASFSASAGYKESSSEIESGESVFILSRAGCRYYYMRLLEDDPPPFHPLFVQWLLKLNSTDDETVYIDFLNRYGTHFLEEVNFGASFTYQYQMTSKTYEDESSKGVNVAAHASYSGLFSIGGGFNLGTEQRQAASEFRNKVETQTITVGAPPPANGDSLTWASTVKENPVPVHYKLASIEKLFSKSFMGSRRIGGYNVDCDKLSKRIEEAKGKYCEVLKYQGQTDECLVPSFALTLKNTMLHDYYHLTRPSSIDICYHECSIRSECIAATCCKEEDDKVCFFYRNDLSDDPKKFASYKNECVGVIFPSKIQYNVSFEVTGIIGTKRIPDTPIINDAACFDECQSDAYCVAFTFDESLDYGVSNHCTLYSKVLSLFYDQKTTTYFIQRF